MLFSVIPYGKLIEPIKKPLAKGATQKGQTFMDTMSLSIPSDSGNQQTFNFNGVPVRVVLRGTDPWFVTGDVCKALDLKNVTRATERLDDDEKDFTTVQSLGGNQTASIISESGLYSLILTSRTDDAREFKRFITHEVIPSVRKTGVYAHPKSIGDTIVAIGEAFQALERRMDEGFAGVAQSIEAINARVDNAEYFTVEHYCKAQGIRSTRSINQKWGKEASALSRARGIQIRKVATPNKTWDSENLYHQSILAEVCVAKPKNIPGQLRLLKDGDQ